VTTHRFRLGPDSARPHSLAFLLIALLVVFLIVFLIIGASPSSAQRHPKPEKPYALIFGTVWGPDDHPVYGVTVKIRRAKDKKARWQLYSDHHGEFAQRVPPGESDYILWADLKGYKPADGKPLRLVQEVTVHVYNDEREDTGLHLTY
jgi:hypothetical protein